MFASNCCGEEKIDIQGFVMCILACYRQSSSQTGNLTATSVWTEHCVSLSQGCICAVLCECCVVYNTGVTMREQETGGGRSDSPPTQSDSSDRSPTVRHSDTSDISDTSDSVRHCLCTLPVRRQCPTVRHAPTLVRHWSDSPTVRQSDSRPTGVRHSSDSVRQFRHFRQPGLSTLP